MHTLVKPAPETEPVRVISGDDWEAEIIALLMMKYGPGDFIEVPAKDRGDLGIDGIGRDGVIYQCYAPEEPLEAGVRKRYQKSKISSDLPKLLKKQSEYKKLLGDIIIRRWIMIVPILGSKEVQMHAVAEAEKIKLAGCPYIASDFSAVVCSDKFVEAQRKALTEGVLKKLHLSEVLEPSQSEIDAWCSDPDNEKQVASLRGKLGKLPKAASSPSQSREQKYIKWYLRGQVLFRHLGVNHTVILEKVIAAKRAFEIQLELRTEFSTESGDKRLIAEMQDYRQELVTCIKHVLHDENINQLVAADIAGWLMECPLDFP